MPTVGDVASFLRQFAPPELAWEKDNVGLLLGDGRSAVERILTCLTVTPEVVAEAIDERAQMIVTHHPILFRPVQRLSSETREGQMLLPLMRAGVAVYSPHTAFDNTKGGINEMLAGRLGLTEVGPLRKAVGKPSYKVVVFVPEADFAKVSDAMFGAGAGRIGDYEQCSFRTPGTGTFFGTEATNPVVGERGRREEVSEFRLEVVCPERDLGAVLAAMKRAHSYEEVAHDVYPLKANPGNQGEGRIGKLAVPTTVRKLAAKLKKQLRAGGVQLVGPPDREVTRVAIACGAGGEMFADAVRARADVFVSGEMRFHDYLAAEAQHVALLLPGHYATERFAVEELAGMLATQWAGVTATASVREHDPVTWL